MMPERRRRHCPHLVDEGTQYLKRGESATGTREEAVANFGYDAPPSHQFLTRINYLQNDDRDRREQTTNGIAKKQKSEGDVYL